MQRVLVDGPATYELVKGVATPQAGSPLLDRLRYKVSS